MEKIEKYKKIALKTTLIAFAVALVIFQGKAFSLPFIPLLILRFGPLASGFDIGMYFYAGVILDLLLLISLILIFLSPLSKSNYSIKKILYYTFMLVGGFIALQFLVITFLSAWAMRG